MVVDLFLVYSFIKRLVKPFDEWEAYKLGIIDDEGNILIPRKKFTKKAQRDAFGVFDKLILNIKKLLAKLPGGQTRLGSYAAALWLIKEQANMKQAGMLHESVELEDSDIEYMLEGFVDEYAQLLEKAKDVEEDAPTVNVGGGAIAGLGVGPQGEPGLTPAQQKKYKKKNQKTFKEMLDDLDEVSLATKIKATLARGARGPSKKATPSWARTTGKLGRKNKESAKRTADYQARKRAVQAKNTILNKF